jgi:hypothetical protein
MGRETGKWEIISTGSDRRQAGRSSPSPRHGELKPLLFIALRLVVSHCPMSLSPRRRKRDPLSLLILVVVIGMVITLLYQVHIYYGGERIPFARQAPVDRVVGG